MTYGEFLHTKICAAPESGFNISLDEINPALLPHQKLAVQWAVKGGRRGYGIELNPDYFRDGVGYLKAEEAKDNQITLFDVV